MLLGCSIQIDARGIGSEWTALSRFRPSVVVHSCRYPHLKLLILSKKPPIVAGGTSSPLKGPACGRRMDLTNSPLRWSAGRKSRPRHDKAGSDFQGGDQSTKSKRPLYQLGRGGAAAALNVSLILWTAASQDNLVMNQLRRSLIPCTLPIYHYPDTLNQNALCTCY